MSQCCPVCESRQTDAFFELTNVPVSDGYLPRSRAEALSSPVGDIHLQFCRTCGHVWNRLFDPAKLQFDEHYDISLFHSQSYRQFVDSLVKRLVDTYDLRDSTALEIACGKGDFLDALVRGGMARGIGFDPTFVESSLSAEQRERIEVRREYYTAAHGAMDAHLICCRSALQYFTKPREFVQMIRSAIGDRATTVVYMEVPDSQEVFRDNAVWNLVYEHGCFYCASSLSTLMQKSGFDVRRVASCFGGQNLGIDATPASSTVGKAPDLRDEVEQLALRVAKFAGVYEERLSHWRAKIEQYRAQGKRAVLWGAGARAISFCCALDVTGVIEQVVDINPKRQGRFLPKTGQEVIAPKALKGLQPQVVVATNPTFAAEIESQARQLVPDAIFEVL